MPFWGLGRAYFIIYWRVIYIARVAGVGAGALQESHLESRP